MTFAAAEKGKTMTNFEFIKTLDAKEMTEFLCDFRSYGAPDNGYYPCAGCLGEEYCRKGHTGIGDWLRAEYEEE